MNARLSQLFTMVLVGACAFFLLLIILFQFGVGRGYKWWALDEGNSLAQGKDLDHTSFSLPAWDSFADVNKRPLFNEDRRPTPPPPPEAPPPSNEKPIPKLNIVLSGVIISSKLRLALIKENGKQQSTAIKEGGALSGDLGAWSLAQVKPRSAVFKSTAGESVDVELIASAIDQKPTPLASPPPAQPNPGAQLPPPTAATAPAVPPAIQAGEPKPAELPAATADLQQRIETRRQQLREQNERARQQQAQSQ